MKWHALAPTGNGTKLKPDDERMRMLTIVTPWHSGSHFPYFIAGIFTMIL